MAVMNINFVYNIAAKALKKSKASADQKDMEDALKKKANGEGITLSINESGGLRVTYDDGK